jgi:hypothetical protein
VRLTGRRWYEFLEEEDLIDIGKDPARFPIAVRERYLEIVRGEGTEAVSEEAAVEQMTRYHHLTYHHLTLLRPSADIEANGEDDHVPPPYIVYLLTYLPAEPVSQEIS